MDHEGITKSKPGNLMEEGLREDMDQRQGARRTTERNE